MNFSRYWVNLIMECVSTVQFSILVNGCPTKSFKPSRGLRQGNPISPYLFLFCANILSLALQNKKRWGRLKVLKLGGVGCHSHICFLLMIPSSSSFKMKRILSCILRTLFSGIAQFQVKALILTNQSSFALLTFLKLTRNHLPYPFKLIWFNILTDT